MSNTTNDVMAETYVSKLQKLSWKRLTPEQFNELRIFRSQDRFRLERERSKAAFEEKLRQFHTAYEEEKAQQQLEQLSPFYDKISVTLQIREIRRSMVPAYTFDRFGCLPTEIQWKIWHMAIPQEEPQIHRIALGVESNPNTSVMHQSGLLGSSHIQLADEWVAISPALPLLHVCQDSRRICLKYYTQMPCSNAPHFSNFRRLYFKTACDTFHIGGGSWSQVKLLLDLMIKINSSRPLRTRIQEDLTGLLEIRFLQIDFRIFASLPGRIWAEFPRLEKLTITFFPFAGVGEDDEFEDDVYEQVDIAVPQLGTVFGTRREWIVESAKKVLEDAKVSQGLQNWKLPQIDAVVQRTGHSDDCWIIEEYDPNKTHIFDDDGGDADFDDDSPWYEEAESIMTHEDADSIVWRWKKYYHPSRRVGKSTRSARTLGSDANGIPKQERTDGKVDGDWITDSETERGDPQRAFIYEDEEW